MQTSKLIAGLLSLGLVVGGGVAVSRSSDQALANAANARDAICGNTSLSMIDQNECVTKLRAAHSAIAKQQVVIRYQSKIERTNTNS